MEKEWLKRAKETAIFHRNKVKLDRSHRVIDTADELNRSVGSVNQDLLIANWYKTHGVEIEKKRTMNDALEFIRNKKYSLVTEQLDDD